MFLLEKQFRFEASHQLPNHDGKCARLHGHSWKMTVIVAGNTLQGEEMQVEQPHLTERYPDFKDRRTSPKAGMLVDYGDLKKHVQPFVDKFLDHWHLNDSTGLKHPTSENLAVFCYDTLKTFIPNLYGIKIEETCTSAAFYLPTKVLNGVSELTQVIDRETNSKG